ncbi:ec1 protein [Colletotrichum graminicola]|nr:ec1 protein [Colletotrichum graminicola]
MEPSITAQAFDISVVRSSEISNMKLLFPLILFAAVVTAATPQLLAKLTRDLNSRAVYPQDGQVCCRTNGSGKECVSLPPVHGTP